MKQSFFVKILCLTTIFLCLPIVGTNKQTPAENDLGRSTAVTSATSFSITGAIPSTSYTNGALTVLGGVGIAGNLNVGGIINGSASGISGPISYTFSPANFSGTAYTGVKGRTVQQKLNDWYDVKDFGAVGNGVTDDTAAIQAAINCANANGGGQVWIPAGTYKTSNTIVILKNVDLRAARNSVTIKPNANFNVLRPHMGSCMEGINVDVTSLGLNNFTNAAIYMYGSDSPFEFYHTQMSGFTLNGPNYGTGLGPVPGYGIRMVCDNTSDGALDYIIFEDFNINGLGIGISLEAGTGTTGFVNANTFNNFNMQSNYIGVQCVNSNPFAGADIEGNIFTNYQIESAFNSSNDPNMITRAINVVNSNYNFFQGTIYDDSNITIEVNSNSIGNQFLNTTYNSLIVDNGDETQFQWGVVNTNINFQKNHEILLDATGANLSVGFYATPLSNASGTNNSAIGCSALANNSNGSYNCAFGSQACYANIDGDDNVGIGVNTLYSATGASNNVAIGSNALFSNTRGTQNVAIGNEANVSNKSGNYNTALGVKRYAMSKMAVKILLLALVQDQILLLMKVTTLILVIMVLRVILV